MNDAFVDFQMHTTASDGAWTREHLFDEIRAKNLELFSITDHDTIAAYPVPDDIAGRCVPGLEVDTEHDGHTVHLLAYGITDDGCALLRALAKQRREREVRMREIVERMQGLGVDVTYDDVLAQVKGGSSVGRPHLARALVAKGVVPDVQSAFDRYIADDERCFVKLKRLTSPEIIGLIHESGGVAVIAHPKRLRQPQHLDELVAFGADGVEVVHPTATPQDEQMLFAFADAHGLVTTGGTDFHAPETHPPIGVHFPRERVERFLERVAAIA
ncbi:MAG TPA: PHP domain-containing protein [Candidatus Eremiobacteraceae bacterium]|nr:PHP domain-containing protein [Candidatus Eremiobacteraceae bacterium]